MQKKIIIAPCHCGSAASEITLQATQELCSEGKAETYQSRQHGKKDCPADIFLLYGCDKKCAREDLCKERTIVKYELVLSDLAIEPENKNDISKEDIELAKDGVIAACTPVKTDYVPLFPGCSCC